MCADNKQDFFEASPWSLDSYTKTCAQKYGIRPQPYWVMTNYLGTGLSGVTNIIFRLLPLLQSLSCSDPEIALAPTRTADVFIISPYLVRVYS